MDSICNYVPHIRSIYLPNVILVGGKTTPLKNDGVRQWGWDDIPYF